MLAGRILASIKKNGLRHSNFFLNIGDTGITQKIEKLTEKACRVYWKLT